MERLELEFGPDGTTFRTGDWVAFCWKAWYDEENFLGRVIVMINRARIKAEAKMIMKGARVSPYIMTLLVMAIVFVLDRVTDLVEGGSPFYSYGALQRYLEILESGNLDALEQMFAMLRERTGETAFFLILVSLVGIILNGGYYIYCIGIRRGAEMPYATLADGLGSAGKLIWCWVQMSVKISLWSLLFWIPGIVARYRYRFAYYNILTDSSLSAGDAIKLSCQQTRGMKAELFVLDLSFIGWSLLSSVTFGLLDIWLTPYMTLCDLAYFEEGQRRVGRGHFNGRQGDHMPPMDGDPWGPI